MAAATSAACIRFYPMAWNFRPGLPLLALLLLGASPALGASFPGNGGPLPGYPDPRRPVAEEPRSPYPMNYSEEAAQALGFKDGHSDFFATRPQPNNPLMPVLSGGLGKGGAMLKLQWRSAP
jgi:hypothetical protein